MIRVGITLFILLGLAGCGRTPQPLYPLEPSTLSIPPEPDQYDPGSTGQIHGRVTWNGPQPDKASFYYPTLFPGELGLQQPLRNPLIPRIDANNGLGDVVVYLRGIDPRRARPWDLPEARVELQNEQMGVIQGNATNSRFGFVRVGQELEMVSRDSKLQLLRGRDAAFFTIALAKPNDPRRQRLTKIGRVELSSASMLFWMRSWLFVTDHPYFTRTNEDGQFSLHDVPEGTYELVSAVPNWHLDRAERDPELMAFARIWYRPMVEQVQRVEVKRGEAAKKDFQVQIEDFNESHRPGDKNSRRKQN